MGCPITLICNFLISCVYVFISVLVFGFFSLLKFDLQNYQDIETWSKNPFEFLLIQTKWENCTQSGFIKKIQPKISQEKVHKKILWNFSVRKNQSKGLLIQISYHAQLRSVWAVDKGFSQKFPFKKSLTFHILCWQNFRIFWPFKFDVSILFPIKSCMHGKKN